MDAVVTVHTCPGCGAAIAIAPPPPPAGDYRPWLEAPYWCSGCGGTTPRIKGAARAGASK